MTCRGFWGRKSVHGLGRKKKMRGLGGLGFYGNVQKSDPELSCLWSYR
jgi:hypothetical protein